MSDTSAEGINVLVISDPGLPARRVESVKEAFERTLQHLFSTPVEVYTRTDLIRINPENTIEFADARKIASDYDRIDVTVLLTEIPRHTGGHPLVSEIFPEEQVAVLSCPTFGAWSTKKRILTTMVDSVIRIAPTAEHRDPERYGLRWTEWSDNAADDGLVLTAGTFLGKPRMVLGMTVANDPWRTAPQLSSALAAASATGAFGIFYHSIWQMSDALSTTRLLFIGLLAVSAMVFWLIAGNRLWDRPRHERYSTVVLLYNLSTILTLALCTLILYACLVLLILAASAIVIDPDFMSQVVGTEVGPVNYLDIAWLSAAMGTVAGALGSSFDSETDLRRLTHGQRERQRRYTEDYTQEKRDRTAEYVERASSARAENEANEGQRDAADEHPDAVEEGVSVTAVGDQPNGVEARGAEGGVAAQQSYREGGAPGAGDREAGDEAEGE